MTLLRDKNNNSADECSGNGMGHAWVTEDVRKCNQQRLQQACANHLHFQIRYSLISK